MKRQPKKKNFKLRNSGENNMYQSLLPDQLFKVDVSGIEIAIGMIIPKKEIKLKNRPETIFFILII